MLARCRNDAGGASYVAGGVGYIAGSASYIEGGLSDLAARGAAFREVNHGEGFAGGALYNGGCAGGASYTGGFATAGGASYDVERQVDCKVRCTLLELMPLEVRCMSSY